MIVTTGLSLKVISTAIVINCFFTPFLFPLGRKRSRNDEVSIGKIYMTSIITQQRGFNLKVRIYFPKLRTKPKKIYWYTVCFY